MSSGICSMTGYGRSSTRLGNWQFEIECRSVNHDRLSVRIDAPDELGWLRARFRKRLGERLNRGRIDVCVRLQPASSSDESAAFDRIDPGRFEAVVDELKRLADEHVLETPVSLVAAMEYRPFFERTGGDVLSEEDGAAVVEVFDEALTSLIEGRRSEGASIQRQLEEQLRGLTAKLGDVQSLRADEKATAKTRAEQRLRTALEQFDLDEIDEGRLTQEVAYYVEKGDITEEIERARAHIEQLEALLESAGGEAVGKKIDFYLQELIRETNTMGSKSRHAGLTDRVIEMKSIVEKMREQVANVE